MNAGAVTAVTAAWTRAWTRVDWAKWERPLLVGNIVAGILAVIVMVVGSNGFGWDARAYWQIDAFHPYPVRDYGASGAFFYSPAVALIAAPFRLLPWEVFLGLMLVADVLALAWLVGWRWTGYAILLPPVMNELIGANIDLPLTVAMVVGLAYPALWASILLTKVSPGVALLWFAARREWRALVIALGTTAVIAAISFVIAPQAWFDWISILADNAARPASELAFPVPLVIRLPLAALLALYAGRTNRPWLVPIAALLGFAVIWRPHYVVLLGSIAIWRRSRGV